MTNTDEPINVGHLRAILKDLPEDLPIVMSSDPEGNSYLRLWTAERVPADELELAWGFSIDGLDVFGLWPG